MMHVQLLIAAAAGAALLVLKNTRGGAKPAPAEAEDAPPAAKAAPVPSLDLVAAAAAEAPADFTIAAVNSNRGDAAKPTGWKKVKSVLARSASSATQARIA